MARSDPEHMLQREFLWSQLAYDPSTGIFRWKQKRGRIAMGSIAGNVDTHGHRVITLNFRRYMAHRLAWFYIYGKWPVGEIDHIDMDGDNNRILNLRDTCGDRTLQRANQKVRADSTVGFKGVKKTPKGRFAARITSRGKVEYLGTFDTPHAAHAAYSARATELFGSYARNA